MGRRPKDPLRSLTVEEQADLASISRARSAPAEAVTRAKILLAVAQGMNYTQAAQSVGRKSNDAVSALVSRFNQEGLDALLPQHGGGFQVQYGEAAKARILREFERQPDLEQDGTATWSLTMLQRALREAPDGLPRVSTYTILNVLHEADYSWQHNRSWSQTGQAVRKRKTGKVIVTDPDTEAKKRGSNKPISWGKRWVLRCGAKMKQVPMVHTPGPVGNWKTTPLSIPMNIFGKAPPK
jgi:transposase